MISKKQLIITLKILKSSNNSKIKNVDLKPRFFLSVS